MVSEKKSLQIIKSMSTSLKTSRDPYIQRNRFKHSGCFKEVEYWVSLLSFISPFAVFHNEHELFG